MRRFEHYHPAVVFLYFISTIFLTMYTMHPVLLVMSFVASIVYGISIQRVRVFLIGLGFYLPMFLLIALTNPLFSHRGVTILFFLNDNPVTLESILYGIAIAGMLISVMLWFSSYTKIITSDKIVYLFGKITPKLALILSMGIHFVPNFLKQLKRLHQTQTTFGLYQKRGFINRMIKASKVLSAMVSISMENALETANSMKSRGYGLPKRTTYDTTRVRKRDWIAFAIWITVLGLTIVLLLKGFASFHYYPTISTMPLDGRNLIAYGIMGIWFFYPVLIEVKENLRWAYLKSKI